MALALLAATITLAQIQAPLSANSVIQAAAGVSISPTTVLPNQYVAVTGNGFTTGGDATIVTLLLGGAAVSSDKINFGSTVKIDSSGKFVANLVVPVNSTTLTPGSYPFSATDSSGKSSGATLTIATPSITLSPTTSRAGSTITVTGANFPLGDTSTSTDHVPLVSINYNVTSNNPKRVASILPNSNGAFTTTFKVPLSATIPSANNRVSTAMPGTAATATATHSVTGPTVTASSTVGTPGTSVTITGTNFSAFYPVTSFYIGGVKIEIPVTLTTGAQGQFTLSGTVPPVENGTHAISVAAGGSTYTMTFTVQGSVPINSVVPTPAEIDIGPTTYPLDSGGGLLGDNLVRVFRFDNANKQWTFYDPNPEFAAYVTLNELVTGKAYWIEVKERQSKAIQGRYLDLFEGWNLVAW